MVKVQGHGQIPIRSRAHVYAGGSGGGQRRRARAAAAGARRESAAARGCFQKAARFLLGGKIRVVISFVSPRYRQDILGLWKTKYRESKK